MRILIIELYYIILSRYHYILMKFRREFKSVLAKDEICKNNLRPKTPKEFNEKLLKILEDCWQFNPTKRPTAGSLYLTLRSMPLESFIPEEMCDRSMFFHIFSIFFSIKLA